MSEAKHTPTPWHVKRKWSNGCEVCPDIVASNTDWVATIVGAPHLGHHETLPNAEFIARAVNSHEALVKMCQRFEQYLLSEGDPFDGDDYQLMQDLRQTLKNAGVTT